ncbi:uncharacterized protein LOC127832554 isoform X1 [Dreissena polymorpha]|uniref:uncharacterized protein LOC127832554 isoform X1 n=2 Tax=Dreissena polymorpha TaxID=45954 RepID=UPI0022654EFF|nr:uncharacterized protein LOC127832554 isoform X1 [Dreissena polymorpha]
MSKIAHTFQDKARTGDVVISEAISFDSLLLSKTVLNGLKNSGFDRPSPIQLKAIPLGRCGLDLIVQAKSGTGKTCVFSVVALETVLTDTASTQILVLAPTREIAVQIWEVMTGLGSAMKGLECHTFIGGMPLHEDRMKLKKCHIAVGTPGRIKQLIEGGVLLTDSIRLFILDEADKLLEESFQEQINWIYSMLPDNKQMLALSATYPEYLADHLTAYMRNPTFLRLNISDPALLGIRQFYALVPYHPIAHAVFEEKTKALVHLLSSVSFQQCLIFSNLQTRAQTLADVLNSKGWPTACIAGCLDQRDRNHAMAKLKTYKCRILISTDLTSRGIDADKVNLVVNLDVPKDHETYLHRIGRAGRFGSFGIAVTLVSDGQEQLSLDSIQKRCNTQVHPLPDPIPTDLTNPGTPVYLDDLVSSEVINTATRHLVKKGGTFQPIKNAGKTVVETGKTEVVGTLSAVKTVIETEKIEVSGTLSAGKKVLETGKTEVMGTFSAGKTVLESGYTEVAGTFSSALQTYADSVSADTGDTDKDDADLSKDNCSNEDKFRDITNHIEAKNQEDLDDFETLKPDAKCTEWRTNMGNKMITSKGVICEKPEADSSASVHSKANNRDMSSSGLLVVRNAHSSAPFNASGQKWENGSAQYSASGLCNINDSRCEQVEEAKLNKDNICVYKSDTNEGQSNGDYLGGKGELKGRYYTVFCKDKTSQCKNIKKLDLVQLFQSMIGFQHSGKTCSYASNMESFTRFKDNEDSTCYSTEPEIACVIPNTNEQNTEALYLRENVASIQEALNECGRFRQADMPKLSRDHGQQQLSIHEDEQAKSILEISTGTSNNLTDCMDSHIKAEIPYKSGNQNTVPSKFCSKLEVSPPIPSERKYKSNQSKSRPKAAGYRNKFAVAYLMQDGMIEKEEEQVAQNMSYENKDEKVSQVNEENKEPLETYYENVNKGNKVSQLNEENKEPWETNCESQCPVLYNLDIPIETNKKLMKSRHSELKEELLKEGKFSRGLQELQERLLKQWQPSFGIQKHAVNETDDSSEDSFTDSTESGSVTDNEDSSSDDFVPNAQTLSKAKSGCSTIIENKNFSLRHPPFPKASRQSFHTSSHQQDQQKESVTVPLHSYKGNTAKYSSDNDSRASGQKACINGVEDDYERRMHSWHNEYQSWCARFQSPSMAHYPPFYGQSGASGLYESFTYSHPYPYYNNPFGFYSQNPVSYHGGVTSLHSGNFRRQFNDQFEIQSRYLKEMSRYVWNTRQKK